MPRTKQRTCSQCGGTYSSGPGGLSNHRATQRHMDAAGIATLAPIADAIRQVGRERRVGQ